MTDDTSLHTYIQERARFASVVSHDLKTPLNAIIGFTSVLMSDSAEFQPEQAKQLKLVYESARSLLDRVNRLLDLYRLEAGRVDLKSEWFYPAEIVMRVVEDLRQEASAGPAIEAEVRGAPSRLRTSGSFVERIAFELARNAKRYGGPGVAVITLKAEPAMGGRRRVRLTVTDPGRGPAPETARLLASALSSGGRPHERGFAGLGLGLALCREAAFQLGGAIEFEPSETGTRAALVLDLDAADVED